MSCLLFSYVEDAVDYSSGALFADVNRKEKPKQQDKTKTARYAEPKPKLQDKTKTARYAKPKPKLQNVSLTILGQALHFVRSICN